MNSSGEAAQILRSDRDGSFLTNYEDSVAWATPGFARERQFDPAVKYRLE